MRRAHRCLDDSKGTVVNSVTRNLESGKNQVQELPPPSLRPEEMVGRDIAPMTQPRQLVSIVTPFYNEGKPSSSRRPLSFLSGFNNFSA